ncbi:MAG: hypothetical protein ACYDH1_16720 [Anaerolineaceae bacterium]
MANIQEGSTQGIDPERTNPGNRPGISQLIPGDFLILVGELVGRGKGWPTSRKDQLREPTRDRPTDSWRLSDIGW